MLMEPSGLHPDFQLGFPRVNETTHLLLIGCSVFKKILFFCAEAGLLKIIFVIFEIILETIVGYFINVMTPLQNQKSA